MRRILTAILMVALLGSACGSNAATPALDVVEPAESGSTTSTTSTTTSTSTSTTTTSTTTTTTAAPVFAIARDTAVAASTCIDEWASARRFATSDQLFKVSDLDAIDEACEAASTLLDIDLLDVPVGKLPPRTLALLVSAIIVATGLAQLETLLGTCDPSGWCVTERDDPLGLLSIDLPPFSDESSILWSPGLDAIDGLVVE